MGIWGIGRVWEGKCYTTKIKWQTNDNEIKKKNNYKVIFIFFLMNYVSSYRVLGVCYLVSPHLVFQLLLNYHYLLVSSHKVLMIALTPINNFSLWWNFSSNFGRTNLHPNVVQFDGTRYKSHFTALLNQSTNPPIIVVLFFDV